MAVIKEIITDLCEDGHDLDEGTCTACGYEESAEERDERLQDIEDDRRFEAWREERWER